MAVKKFIVGLDKWSIVLWVILTVNILSSLSQWLKFANTLIDWVVFFIWNGLRVIASCWLCKVLKTREEG